MRRARFEDVLAHRNHLGILPEDIDIAKGALWGNFPADLFHGGDH